MKFPVRNHWHYRALFLGALFCLLLSPRPVRGQGTLSPPGAPSPLFKTLSQVEPRTPINTLPGDSLDLFIISQPGAYYLTTNVYVSNTNGIRILTNDVDIDLHGFTLAGLSGQTGIRTLGAGVNRVRIRNGRLTGWGTVIGFFAAGPATNAVLEDLQISAGNSAFGAGISCGDSARISRCSITDVTGNSTSAISTGDRSTVEQCTIFNCYGGIICGSASTVRSCLIKRCSGDDAIRSGDSCIIENNLVDACKSGISFYNSCVVKDNSCQHLTAGSGFSISGNFNRVDSNLSISNSGSGFISQGSVSNNIITRNLARGNTAGNFNVSLTDSLGPLISTTGLIATNNPWANFSY